jgi:glutamate dehydrogenase
MQKSMQSEGTPEELAVLALRKSPTWMGISGCLGAANHLLQRLFRCRRLLIETSARRKMDVESVARIYFGLGESLRLKWLQEQLESLPVEGQWHTLARANLRDELFSIQNILVETCFGRRKARRCPYALDQGPPAGNEKVSSMLNDMFNLPAMDYATVSVAVRALGNMFDSNGQ